tara:strand:+ start:451 stop:840 length:390 start_codon:yes stop_codon:yes gene_type:complete
MDKYFFILGCTPNDSKKTIKKKYYQLMKIYHPDKTQNSPELLKKCQELNEAYEKIMNEEAPVSIIPLGFRKMGFVDKIPTTHEYVTRLLAIKSNGLEDSTEKKALQNSLDADERKSLGDYWHEFLSYFN